MIGLIFKFGADTIEVRIDGNKLVFRTSQYGSQFYPIEALHFDKKGVMKEFPDLQGMANWREVAVERFRDKVKAFPTEEECAEYIVEDLVKFGYTPLLKQKTGHRVQKIKWHGST